MSASADKTEQAWSHTLTTTSRTIMTAMNDEGDLITTRTVNPDLFSDPDWPLFDFDRAQQVVTSVPRIALLEFVCREAGYPKHPARQQADCVAAAKSYLFGSSGPRQPFRPYLFLVNSWQPRNRITLYKRLWRSFREFPLHVSALKNEVLVAGSEGIRFAGIASLDISSFSEGINVLKNRGDTPILFTSHDVETDDHVLEMYHHAFPHRSGNPYQSLDWMAFAVSQCSANDWVVRAGEEHDNRSFYIDVFVNADQVALPPAGVTIVSSTDDVGGF